MLEVPRRSLLYVPDTDAWEAWSPTLVERLRGVDVAVLDGSFFSADELPGRAVSSIGHPLITRSMDLLEPLVRSGAVAVSRPDCVTIHVLYTPGPGNRQHLRREVWMPQPRAQTKLTVRLPREDLDFLRRYAAAHGLSVVEVIARHLSELRDQEAAAAGSVGERTKRDDPPETRAQFEKLAEDWRQATRFVSSLTDMIAHPAYQRIIGMGLAVVPLILDRLRLEPDHWFWALKAITGEDPVPAEARGDIRAMSAAWLAWGRQHGYASVG